MFPEVTFSIMRNLSYDAKLTVIKAAIDEVLAHPDPKAKEGKNAFNLILTAFLINETYPNKFNSFEEYTIFAGDKYDELAQDMNDGLDIVKSILNK